ncbi:MAG: hypothetical protein J6B68_08555 [Lachnospiraceae bacterium]|nr:hypothetical protein [Lachnospiraceae bacterium]
MSRKKEICLCIILLFVIFVIINCSEKVDMEADSVEDVQQLMQEQRDYEKSNDSNAVIDSLETIKSIVNQLGEKGYVAIDSENQVNMTEAEQVIRFCEQVDNQEEAELSIWVISYSNELIKYDLKTESGNVDIVREYFQYNNGQLQSMNTENYQADFWQYTEEGYLIFSGSWYLEEQYVLSLSGEEEHVALRVLPLDEKCRELNRKYIRPVGYGKNNMFLSNWSEDDFGELNFYDLYDIFYPMIKKQSVPYVADENLEVRASYRIPKEEFENIIMTYFKIDSETLQSKATYFSEDETYEYKPRGFYEVEYPEIPYPEVISYLENSDGTITLTVNAVYPNENISKLFVHEVVVRPMRDGNFQYVSNRVIVPADNSQMWWHTNRLEMEEAEADCARAMELFRGIYESADKGKATNVVLSDETVLAIQNEVKENGSPVTTKVIYSNMENYGSMETFLKTCAAGKSGEVVTFEIRYDGGVRRKKYIFDGTDMYLFSTSAIWDEDNQPKIADSSYTPIEEWEYTDKGWFCYELRVPEPPEVTEILDGSCIVRVKPMTEERLEMSQKCVQTLGYQGNNLLYSNWDINHMEELDYNGIYEYFYQMKFGERFNPETCPNGVPKEEFENLIMEYLPITAEQIQEYAVFDEETKTYVWKPLGCYNGTPTFFGTSIPEVTNIVQNEDGTTTLTVDAVCDMVILDDAVITHELTVRFAEDGSFQYLGNKILNDGVKEIPNYQYRCRN